MRGEPGAANFRSGPWPQPEIVTPEIRQLVFNFFGFLV